MSFTSYIIKLALYRYEHGTSASALGVNIRFKFKLVWVRAAFDMLCCLNDKMGI
jgi:hypothetical protein